MSQDEQKSIYQGRIARRYSSEQRRLTILRAALSIAAQDGVRAIRHRAVATVAKVPLSATTYYFKDIHDLITDAFVLFSREAKELYVDPFWNELFQRIELLRQESLPLAEWRERITTEVASSAAHYIVQVVATNRAYLQTEFAFTDAALHDERLGEHALFYLDNILGGMRQLMRLLEVDDVDAAAKSLFALVRRIQLEAMLNKSESLLPELVTKELYRQIRSAYAR